MPPRLFDRSWIVAWIICLGLCGGVACNDAGSISTSPDEDPSGNTDVAEDTSSDAAPDGDDGDTEIVDARDISGDGAADAEEDGDGTRDVERDGEGDGSGETGIGDVRDGGDGGMALCDYKGISEGVCQDSVIVSGGDAQSVDGSSLDGGGVCQRPPEYESDESSCETNSKTNLDNDCDGITNEGCSCNALGRQEGVCQNGTISQKDGKCEPPSSFQTDETKCDGKDNDCDGAIDENCPCNYKGKSDGVCAQATRDTTGTCTEPSDYAQEETGSSSLCDAKDNDCDGEVDEQCSCSPVGKTESCYTGPSGTAGTGVCKKGTRTCESGGFSSCKNEVTPSPESCNGKDDDCDGVTDEGCSCDYKGSTTGICKDGGTINNNGDCRPPSDYSSAETTCDNKDNDCDGVVDERCPCAYQGTSVGVCASSTIDPQSGNCQEPGDYTSTDDESSVGLCDNKDNDCDGTVDEGCSCQDGTTQSCYTGPAGTAGTGICEKGTRTCTNGSFGSCQNETTPKQESCSSDGTGNGTDEDCDGTTDEGCRCNYNNTSTGVCSDGKIDNSGSCTAPTTYESSESSCDGLDNDCDGVTDEGCTCNYNNTSDGVCSGETIDSSGNCTEPNNYESPEQTCSDGLDNDCDSDTDCADSDCSGDACGTGSGATCQNQTCTENNCQDGIDNDQDGKTDCADPDCAGEACGTGNGAICQNQTCVETNCRDTIDNDQDGDTSCEDSDCTNKECGGGGPATQYCCPNPSSQCTQGCGP